MKNFVKDFVKRFLLCCISLSLFLMSINVMYLKVSAAELPIKETVVSESEIDVADLEIGIANTNSDKETKSSDDPWTGSLDYINSLTVEDLPEDAVFLFNELGYSDKEVLDLVKEYLIADFKAQQDSVSKDADLYNYEESFSKDHLQTQPYNEMRDTYTSSHKGKNQKDVGDVISEAINKITKPYKDAANFIVTLYDQNDFVSGEVSNAKASFVDDLSKMGTKDFKLPKRIQKIKKFFSITGESTSKTLGIADDILSSDTVTKATNVIDDAADAVTSGSKYVKGCASVFEKFSGALTVQQIYGDFTDLINNNMYNEKPALAELERQLLIADCAFSIVSLGLGFAGLSFCAPLAVGAFIISIGAAFVHSKTFADAANNSDSQLEFWTNILISLGFCKKTPNGVGCYKPNIYIYNALGLDIDVYFLEPWLLTKTIPDYNGSWKVKEIGNQSLLQTKDGSEYSYLFYESVTNRSFFQTEEGFAISKENRISCFTTILKGYGFNDREIADFVEFWDAKLEKDKDYVMYPQYTETVDKAMPIRINPSPENIVRLWFAFEENNDQNYSKAKAIPFNHDGYTVIEWGGMIFTN